MRFKLYREHGALNSVPVFNAFEQGLISLGHSVVDQDEEIAVIWSVLWQGRMLGNQKIYNSCKNKNVPIVIIEVGNLKRGLTWRVSLNHINGLGEFANDLELDVNRPSKLGINLRSPQNSRKTEILVACQHQHSLQWQGQVPMSQWAKDMVLKIRQYTDRPIVVRPHPRSPFFLDIPGMTLEHPKKLQNTYDEFDIDYNYHCVINHNSGPAIQAAIQGIPIICDKTSLAYPVSSTMENIQEIAIINRDDWFLKLCHTEWTVDEISKGIPQSRLIAKISQNR